MIDTTKFKPLKNRWQDIFKHLEEKGYVVYSPGVKLGDCTFKYLVVKFEGSTRLAGISTDDDLYSVLCYVPQQNYSELHRPHAKDHVMPPPTLFFSPYRRPPQDQGKIHIRMGCHTTVVWHPN